MPHPRYSPQEIAARGQQLYEERIRPLVETANRGKHLVLDVETGDYEIGDDHFAIARRMQNARHDRALYAIRIGCRSLGRIGGSFRASS